MRTSPDSAAGIQGALHLDHWGLIRAQGKDAISFLHSQLTQAVQGLPPDQARLAGFCSAKGRVQASFVFWLGAADEIFLACSADLLAPTLKRLSMFVLRAQCKLEDAGSQWRLFGLVGPAAQAWLGDEAPQHDWGTAITAGRQVVRLPSVQGQARFLCAMPTSAGAPTLAVLNRIDWDWLEVQSAVPRVVAATVDAFVPQMINFELVGGVDFKKGCYPGQEVVARSQYRGTIKRRARLFACDATAQPGLEVFHSLDPGQPAGIVVNAAQGAALVELKLAALEGGTLHLGAPGGPDLRALPMPYDVPAETA